MYRVSAQVGKTKSRVLTMHSPYDTGRSATPYHQYSAAPRHAAYGKAPRREVRRSVARTQAKSSREAVVYGPYQMREPGQSRQKACTSRPPAGCSSARAASGDMCFLNPRARALAEAQITSLYW